ncbi:CamS family sex pheromone protein [Lentilactobacillus sp. Marseille-Q4993]|uniref:CamS family sex pheromone protein n=1 Tax=Lentilactobacillus sp. Marseille-Q4993 TaxID=3039492 RepID=UPI0024BC0388|nr:CamS family sex pheromone protein [Lentilactobacillus sp. Marseille-Q4993]
MLCGILLAACGSADNLKSDNTSDTSKKTQLTGQTNKGYYQGVIKNGHYQTSKSRGVSVSQISNQFNIKGFENGLLDISKDQFSTNKYVFQEGQYLSTGTVTNWLGRKTKKNPTGLNPTSKNSATPSYLAQINEMDFMTQQGKKLSLSGMTIGLGINSVYYYKKTTDGPTYSKDLTNAQIQSQGKEIANKVLQRLRAKKSLKNIPIVIALYKQASDDSLVGGNFFSYSVNNSNSKTVSDWKKINQKNYVFPIQSGKKTPNKNDEDAFENFKSQIQSFFPNLSGVTAQAQYTDGTLSGMNVNITTQFYSQTEIISFTQYVQQAAQKYLPGTAPIDIQIQSTNDIQSFLSRGSGEKSFSAHIFNSY